MRPEVDSVGVYAYTERFRKNFLKEQIMEKKCWLIKIPSFAILNFINDEWSCFSWCAKKKQNGD